MDHNVLFIWPDADRLSQLGLASGHADIPMLVWPGNGRLEGEVFSAAREFMLARAGLSDPITYPPELAPRVVRDDEAKTTGKVASCLANFFRYCIRCRTDWRVILAGHKGLRPSVLHWAYASIDGSSGQSKVSAATVQIRLHYVQHFLWWAGTRGDRRVYEPVRKNFAPGTQRQKRVEELIGLPTEAEVADWMEQVRRKFSRQAYLMIWLMLESGMRTQEVRLLRTSQIPSSPPEDWPGAQRHRSILSGGHQDNPISLEKEDGTKYGKDRQIWVSHELLVALQGWLRIKSQRPRAFREVCSRRPDRSPPETVFFNSRTGDPWSKNYVNQCVIQRTGMVAGLASGHKLRHYFASRFFVHHTVRALRMQRRLGGPDSGYLLDKALDEAENMLRERLGHSHGTTTKMYRRWASQQFASDEHGQIAAMDLLRDDGE